MYKKYMCNWSVNTVVDYAVMFMTSVLYDHIGFSAGIQHLRRSHRIFEEGS